MRHCALRCVPGQACRSARVDCNPTAQRRGCTARRARCAGTKACAATHLMCTHLVRVCMTQAHARSVLRHDAAPAVRGCVLQRLSNARTPQAARRPAPYTPGATGAARAQRAAAAWRGGAATCASPWERTHQLALLEQVQPAPHSAVGRLEVSARRGAAPGARGSTAAAAFETPALATSPARRRWRE
jgi:hypothetical protein